MYSRMHETYLERILRSGTAGTAHMMSSSEGHLAVNGSKWYCIIVVSEVLYYNSPALEALEPARWLVVTPALTLWSY